MNRTQRIASRVCTAKLLDDYGLVAALMRILKPDLAKLKRLAQRDKLFEISDYSFRSEGYFFDLDDTLEARAPELSGFRYSLCSQGGWGASAAPARSDWVSAAYHTSSKTFTVLINCRQARRFITEQPTVSNNWKYVYSWNVAEKAQFLMELDQVELTLRHELTHLIRDAHTMHLTRFVDTATPKQIKRYNETGHDTWAIEIDAQVNEMDQLRRRLGPKKYNSLTLDTLYAAVPTFHWTRKPNIVRKYWRKRLIREGLWTPGMEASLSAVTKSAFRLDLQGLPVPVSVRTSGTLEVPPRMWEEILTWAEGQQAAYDAFHKKEYLAYLQTLEYDDTTRKLLAQTLQALRDIIPVLKRTNTLIPARKPKPRVVRKFKTDFTGSRYQKLLDRATPEQRRQAEKKYGILTVELVLDYFGSIQGNVAGWFSADRSLIRVYSDESTLKHELAHFTQYYMKTLLEVPSFGGATKDLRRQNEEKEHDLLDIEFFPLIHSLSVELKHKGHITEDELHSWLGMGPEKPGFKVNETLQILKQKAPLKWHRAVKELLSNRA
jgi:hypothetical protein